MRLQLVERRHAPAISSQANVHKCFKSLLIENTSRLPRDHYDASGVAVDGGRDAEEAQCATCQSKLMQKEPAEATSAPLRELSADLVKGL